MTQPQQGAIQHTHWNNFVLTFVSANIHTLPFSRLSSSKKFGSALFLTIDLNDVGIYYPVINLILTELGPPLRAVSLTLAHTVDPMPGCPGGVYP